MKQNLNSKFYIVLIFGILNGLLLFAQESVIKVTANVNKSEITIGDRITYTLDIEHNKQFTIEQPGPGANLGQFEIKGYKIDDPVETENMISQKFEYEISVFDTGTFVIPPFPVAFTDTTAQAGYQVITSEPLEIHVKSVLTAEDNEIRDVKPPLEIPFNYTRLILYIVAGLLIIAAIILAIYIIKNRKKGKPLFRREVVRPAHEIALEALAELESQWREMLEAGEYKLLFTGISEILRKYLENRFFIKAMEETSMEIMESIPELNLNEEDEKRVAQILELSDRVKFAKWIPREDETGDCLDNLKMFIHNTKLEFETVEKQVSIENEAETEDVSK